MKQANIPGATYDEHHTFSISFLNGIGAKSRKYVGPRCSPAPSAVKKHFAGHVSEYLCKLLDWVYPCEGFTFHFTNSFVHM